MALVDCHECGHPVATDARACPHCGAPVDKNGRAYTIQLTSKRLKLFELLFVLVMVAGLLWGLAMITRPGNDPLFLCVGVTALGGVGYVMTSFLVWWYHG